VAEEAFQGAWGATVDLSLEIPYHPQLALTEEPHIFRRRRGYLFEAYQAIEARMLQELGHDAQTFHRRIIDSLERKDYDVALQGLRHMIPLDGGGGNLSKLAEQLIRPLERRGSGTEPSQEPVSVGRLLKDEGGGAVMKFIVERLSIGEWDWLTSRLLQELKRNSPELGDRLLERILEVANNADTLDNYAVFLESIGYPADAETFYKRAVESEPKHARCLGNYARFLLRREDIDGADAFYRRAIEADPRNAFNLGGYAVLLDCGRGNMDAAEAFHKRAIDAGPKNANILASYAVFLKNRRGNMRAAELFYKRSIEADPTNAFGLSGYAVFLENQRGNMKAAETFHRRAIQADPKRGSLRANYGQFLAGLARLPDAERILLSAFEHRDTATPSDTAEVCFSLWLVSRLQEHNAEHWERFFKYLIQQGFRRYPWSFDRMLNQSEKKLSSEEFEYAKALALAFLDESKVPELNSYERWRKLEPLEPKPQETLSPVSAA
jgi:Tfp pilus assembly protein PilF